LIGPLFEIATAIARAHPKALQGYPLPTNKKKRVCVVTYQHSGEELFENSSPRYRRVNNL